MEDKINNNEIENNLSKEENNKEDKSLKIENDNNLDNKLNNEDDKKEEKEKEREENNNKKQNQEENENQNIIENDNKKEDENKTNIQNDNKEEDKKNIITEEENREKDEKNKNEKDDNISEEEKEDISNKVLPNSFHSSLGLKRINSEVEFDKIMAGIDESQNNLINLDENYIIEEKNEEEEENIKEGDNLNENNYLGDLFIDFINKKKNKENEEKDLMKMSFYNKQNIDEGPKDFAAIINAQLNEIKDKTLNYFNETIKEFENRYSEYINKITNYINENELKMKKVFEKKIEKDDNILEFAGNNIFQQLENLYEIHQNIFSAIEEHVGLLRTFLEQTNLIQQKNPLEYYINNNSNEIFNCWFLNKINFQKLNLSNLILNKDLSELCSRYLCKKKDNNFSSISLKKDNKGNLSLESDFVKENLNNLEKLKFIELRSDEINSILKIQNKDNKQNNNNNNISNTNSPSAKKLKSLSIVGSDFSSSSLTKIYSPSLKKLKLKRTSLPLSLKVFLESLLCEAHFLQNLYLQKCFLDNRSLDLIFEFLSNKLQLVNSLQNISFSGNDITIVNMKSLIVKGCNFNSLQYLDFSKNNIFEFRTDNFKILPEIKVLDLTNNNMSNYIFFQAIKSQKKKSIVFLNNNMFISNNKTNAENYRQYLKDKLSNFNYKIKRLDFSLLYYKEILNELLDLRISPMIKISLIKLNLSYCGLSDDFACKYLQNNFGLLNLKELNLSNNFLTINIFHLILKIDVSLEKLNCLDLSMNDIVSMNIDQYKQIEKFVNSHPQIKKIKLQGNTFAQELLLISQINKEECERINKSLINKQIKFIVESEHSCFIVPLKGLFEIKDKEIDY